MKLKNLGFKLELFAWTTALSIGFFKLGQSGSTFSFNISNEVLDISTYIILSISLIVAYRINKIISIQQTNKEEKINFSTQVEEQQVLKPQIQNVKTFVPEEKQENNEQKTEIEKRKEELLRKKQLREKYKQNSRFPQ